MVTPIPALDALRSRLRRLHVTDNLVALLTAEIDRAFAVSPVIEGREVYVPLDVLISVRDQLAATDDREDRGEGEVEAVALSLIAMYEAARTSTGRRKVGATRREGMDRLMKALDALAGVWPQAIERALRKALF